MQNIIQYSAEQIMNMVQKNIKYSAERLYIVQKNKYKVEKY